MMDMKKIVAPLLISAVALVSPVASNAFTSKTTVTTVASVTVGGGTASLAVSIHNILDNAVATAITWPAVAAGAGYTLASQYVELDTNLSVAGAGVQTYTDNTAADASPKYTGLTNATTPPHAGLVSATDTTQTLPTAWEITDTTSSINPAVDPTIKSTSPNSFAWFFHEDKSQTVAVPTSNAAAFANGAAFVTAIKSGNQIHFGQDPTEFGAAASPNYVYLEANFASAIGGTTYKTSTLRFELFTQ